jgi:PAS domain S-box-containing protein
MTRRQASPDEADSNDDAGKALRKWAEEKVQAKKPHYSESWLPDPVRQALHELRVHQVELEMQNEELRQRQEELETSRAKYFDFYNLSPVGYFTISGQALILEVNLAAANLLGMARDNILDQPFTRLIAAEDQDIYYLFHKQLFETGKPQTCELRMALQDGARPWARLEATVVEDQESGKPVSHIVVSDITGRKMAEGALLEGERNYRQLTEQASEGIFVVDQQARYLDVNPAGLEMVGYSLEELRGMTITDLMPPSELERAPSRFSEILSGKTIVSERTLRRKDGSLFLAEINAKLMPDGNVLATKRDITERKRRDEENTAHIRYLTSVNQIYREFEPALDLEAALPVALNKLLSIFDCDRAFLLYPLDKDAKTYKIPFEETKPEYPGAFTANKELPVTREVAEIFRIALGASAPVSMNLVEGITDESQLKEFDIKTQLVAPLYPKTGKPWMIGLHQCSRVREWAKEDQALFYAISLVISDKLNNLLLARNLSESEERHRILFNNASVGIGISGEEGRIVAANEMLLKMLGYSRQEFMNMRLNELFAVKKDTDFLFERLSEDDEVHDFETVFRKKDGSEFEASLTVTLYNLGGQRVTQTMILDITERKKAEENIRERMRHAEFIAEIGMALTESGSMRDALGKCCESMVNNLGAAFARVWTFNETENMLELQASAGMYTHIDGGHSRVPVGKFKIGLIAQERKPHLTNEVVGDPRVGDQEWAKREGMAAFAGYPLVIDDKLIGVMAMFAREPLSEMTLRMLKTAAYEIALGVEHRIAEQAIKAALKEAELANKAKSVFLSSMSHEIRTPLTSVIGFSHLLASDAEHPLNDFQKQLLGKVMNSGNQLLDLVNSALDLAKIESGDIETSIEAVEMKSLAIMALTSSAHLAKERGVNLSSQIPTEDCHVMADSILLRQVLTNLLSNAIKYNKKGGETILAWKPFDENKVRISVSDEGIGISEDNIKNLYKPFDRMGIEGRNIQGFGVGLTIVKRLVELMGGEVAVESEVGKGSTFHIDLPGGKKREQG